LGIALAIELEHLVARSSRGQEALAEFRIPNSKFRTSQSLVTSAAPIDGLNQFDDESHVRRLSVERRNAAGEMDRSPQIPLVRAIGVGRDRDGKLPPAEVVRDGSDQIHCWRSCPYGER